MSTCNKEVLYGLWVTVLDDLGSWVDPPPSRHSSSQKYLRLWLSQGSPIKAPHTSAICNTSLWSSSSSPYSGSLSMKKSFRLLLGEIFRQFSLLYLNASEIIFHTKSNNLIALSGHTELPSVSKMWALSSIKQCAVSVSSARRKMGFVKVPWIQLGPLAEVRPEKYHTATLNKEMIGLFQGMHKKRTAHGHINRAA